MEKLKNITVWQLVAGEVSHRVGNFGWSVFSVAVSTACLTGSLLLLRVHDIKTDMVAVEQERRAAADMAQMEDKYRVITKNMGFNVLVLPKDQNLSDFYAEDFASKHMPESYAHTLASSKIVTVQHLLPLLQQKIKWPEQNRTVLLIGVKGEVPMLHGGANSPILQPVPPGCATVGYELHRSLNLKEGDTVVFMGRSFNVNRCHAERGTKDDITLWVNLGEAQEMLGKKGLINGIMALECKCAWSDLAKVRKEITAILPETQVIEFAGQALARAEARNQANATAKAVIEQWKKSRASSREQKEKMASVFVPAMWLACSLWVGLLAHANVRQRKVEIGVLRAVGMHARSVWLLFMGRALLVGGAGSLIGLAIGSGAVAVWGEFSFSWETLFSAGRGSALWWGILILFGATFSSLLAALVPAMIAAEQQPADALREE